MFLTPFPRRNSLDPFRMMDDMEREFFGAPRPGSFSTDIRDNGNELILEADLPGFKKGDINIDIQDGCLTINAQRHSEFEEKDKKGNYVRCERSFGSFSRSFDTTGIDIDAIKASFTDGVLTLTMPKLVEQKPASRKLEIE